MERHWRWCSSSCRSYTGDLRVNEVVVVFRREVGFGCRLVFTEKVINRSPNASSIAAGCADFLPPVCSCLGLRQFTTALQCITPSCSRCSGFLSALNFLSSHRLLSVSCGIRRRTMVVMVGPGERQSSTGPSHSGESSGVHRAVDLSRLMKSADLKVFHEWRVVMT